MNRDDIIRMAREAGGADITVNGFTSWVGTQSPEFLERFAALVAAAERDRAMRMCEIAMRYYETECKLSPDENRVGFLSAEFCKMLIEKREEE